MTNTYKENDIRVLGEIEHIKLNAGMYIGDTTNPVHLVEECLDNALDEALAGYGNIIAVNIDTKKHIYTVIDDGRGIPIGNDVPITISTKLFSGAKFQDKKTAYDISCLIGSTKIFLLNGEHITIDEMTKNPNKEYWGLSSTLDGKWKASKLLHPQITGYTKKFIRVYFDDTFEECTPDHRWLMRDGTYKEAQDLKPEDSLMPCYYKEDEYIYIRPNNHKVKRIEKVTYDKEIPVYDITVPEYNNFVLESGVIVHNSGLHGVGLVAVCALSEFYIIEIYRDNQYGYYEFQNSKLKTKKVEEFEGPPPFSTKIQFKPDKTIFENMVPDIDRIKNRLITASTELPENKILVLYVDGKKEVFQLTVDEYFKKYCLNSDDATDVIYLKSYKNPESFNIIFSYATKGAISPKVMSSVNLLPVDSGGTHVNVLYDMLREFFITKAKKFGYKFSIQDSLVGLRAYLALNLVEPKFSSQTKDKLTNRKNYLDNLSTQLKFQLEKYFLENKDYLELLLDRFQEYRKKLDSKKLKNIPTGKRASTKFTKLKDCTSRKGELFITEGDSAGGTIIQCRDPRMHAILPLKGKIPNIINTKDILKNKEIREIIYAFGTGINSDFNIKKLRYDKIVCAADSDPDGGHIASLITMVIATLTPEIIKSGKFYLARTPLFAINEKKAFIPLWTHEELEKAREDSRTISRFKGLGELNPSQLKVCLIDKDTRNLIPVTYSENIENLIKLFSDVGEKRKLLSNGEDYNE